MKVVLDANIYVSSMVNSLGSPKRIILAWHQGAFDVLLSRTILDEVGTVLKYPRIVRRHEQEGEAIQRLLKLLENETVIVEPTVVVNVIKGDESDNRYLECALEGKARYVISDDKHLLDIGEYKGIIILPPAAFVAVLSGEGL